MSFGVPFIYLGVRLSSQKRHLFNRVVGHHLTAYPTSLDKRYRYTVYKANKGLPLPRAPTQVQNIMVSPSNASCLGAHPPLPITLTGTLVFRGLALAFGGCYLCHYMRLCIPSNYAIVRVQTLPTQQHIVSMQLRLVFSPLLSKA